MALKDIVLKLVIDGKESLVTLDKVDNKFFGLQKKVKNLASAMGLAFGAYEVIGFMKDSIALVQRENEVIGKLNATLKSTNFAAGMTSDELVTLANNLEELTNYKFDDKDIIDAEGLLLTFKRINREVFPEAMRLALDLSVRFDQDLTTSVKQLGKALDDPERGLTALRKAGVLFTDAQQDQINALIKNNDLLSAQKMIMAELSTQVSGSAAASVDEYTLKVNRLNEALESVSLTIGQILTYGGIGFLDWLEGFSKTGSMDGAMVYLKTKQQQSKWTPSTDADYLNEARIRATSEIQGKSDADIRKIIAHNRAMYNASFMGLDQFGVPADPEGTLAMLNAKLAVYQTALIKTDKKVTDDKKKNVYDLAQYQKDLEAIHYQDLMELNDEFYKAQREALDDLPLLPDYEGKPIKSINDLWDEMEDGGKIAISGLMGATDSFWQNFIMDGRQAKDGWDALWLSFKNSALQQLGDILSNELFASLVNSGGKESGGGSFLDDLFSAVTTVLPFLGSGGIATKPTPAIVGDVPEAIIPLDRFDFGVGSGSIERKLDQVITAFENKQFEIDMYKFRSVNKRLDDIENSLRIK